MNQHLQQAGLSLSEKLMTEFDEQFDCLKNQVEKVEEDIQEWEPQIIANLSQNQKEVSSFNTDVKQTMEEMSQAINSKYRLTMDFQKRVRSRMTALESRLYEPIDSENPISIPTLDTNMNQTMIPREAIEQKLIEQRKKESSKQVKTSDPNVSISNASQSDMP